MRFQGEALKENIFSNPGRPPAARAQGGDVEVVNCGRAWGTCRAEQSTAERARCHPNTEKSLAAPAT
jgi:hypothetical protein